MRKILFLGFFFVSYSAFAQHPFKYDSLYKKLYAGEFCDFAKKHPDMQLIDVRTAGEFSDTSQSARLNLGHLKGAVNISSADISKNIHLLDPYKNKTIVFYCSHSQRSRRVSKQASENGFTNFYTINGGMSSLNELEGDAFPCKENWIVNNLPYKKVFSDEAGKLLRDNKDMLVIDMRSKEEFESRDTLLSNNIGRVKGAKNMSFDELKNNLPEIEKNKTAPVFIYASSNGKDPSQAAVYMKSRGFGRIYVLAGDLGDLVASRNNISFMESSPQYTLVDPVRAFILLQANKQMTVYDIRDNDEYTNTSKMTYLNLGHIRSAIHADAASLQNVVIPQDREAPVLIYGNDASYILASELSKNGYKKVYVLSSFYDFVWSAYNVERNKEAKSWLVDHEGLY